MLTKWARINLLCAVFAFGLLSPIVATGYYWDDSVHSGFAGVVVASGLSVPQFLVGEAWHWARDHGRVFPVGIMVVTVKLIFGGAEPLIPKFLHVLLIVGVLAVAARLVVQLSTSRTLGALFMLISPLCFQVRPWHDPLTSFVPLIPLVALSMLGQAVMLDGFLRIGGWWRLFLSVFLFAVALLTYELALVMPLLNAVIVLRRGLTPRRLALTALPYAIVFVLYLTATVAVRSGHVYSGISFGSSDGFGRSFLIHAVGAVPFSYWLFDPRGVFRLGLFQPYDAILIGVLAVGLGAMFMLLWRELAHRKEGHPLVGRLVAFGLVAWISSSILMASSAAYRTEVADFGLAYNASFIGAIGIGILVTSGVALAIAGLDRTLHPRRSIRALGAAIAIVPVFWLFAANTVLRWQEALFGTAQQAEFNRAAKAGLLANVQDGTVICDASRSLYWFSPSYIRMLTHKKVDVSAASCAANGGPKLILEFEKQKDTDWLRRPRYVATLRAGGADAQSDK
jgi:hypothetical protein